jgi:hypothetical protein
MQRETAVALMEIYETLGALFNKATEVIATERDEAEQRRLRQPLGMAHGAALD